MKIKVIACSVFKAEINEVLRTVQGTAAEVEFLELGEHARPGNLRRMLQERIDAASGVGAVALAYGLCGTATEGLHAGKVPLVLPRSHDCCGVLLGSRKRFEELFKPMPSTPFASAGFAESGDYYFNDGELVLGNGDAFERLVEEYGEDNARYVWDAMHPKLDGELRPVYFIHTVRIEGLVEKCRLKAEQDGREFLEIDGDLRLIRMLLSGDWPEDEFLIVPPGKSIRQTGDWDRIMSAV